MVCVCSGAVKCIADHPFKKLHARKFRLTLNTDDRLMSGITLTDEYYIAHTVFGLTIPELHKLTLNAIKSSFMHFDEKADFISGILEPKYTAVMSHCAAYTTDDVTADAEASASAYEELDN